MRKTRMPHSDPRDTSERSIPAAAQASDLNLVFRRIIERLHEAVLVIQEHAFLFANPKAQELLGYSEEELKSGTLRRVVHPEDLDLVLRQSAESVASQTPREPIAFKILSGSGEARWVEMRSEAFSWQGQGATLCFLKDVTAHHLIEEKYRRVVNSTSEGFMMLDRKQRILEVNPALLAMAEYGPGELIGKSLQGIYKKEGVELYSASRDHMSFEANLITRGGRHLPTLFKRSTLRDESGQVIGYLFFLTDLTELKATQDELRRAEQRYHSMYRNAVQGMFQSELSGKFIRVNPAYARILGYDSPDQLLRLKQRSTELYFDPTDRQRMVQALKRKGQLANYEVKLRRRDGQTVWTLANYRLTRDDTGVKIVEGILVDHTRQKRLEEVLRRGRERFRNLSLRDNLTGLFNTRYLYQALDELLEESRSSKRPFSLIFMDMDHFKQVVDTHGHLNGSQALREAAHTIRSAIKKPCFGVAYGGDEFVVVLPGFDMKRALSKAESIRLKMKRTTYLTGSGLAVRLSASFGLASYPDDAEDIKSLLAQADQALFRAKHKDRGSIGKAG
jgi:diguanylate cyclase (GGDEF)-like protein/PAS domain S-box-containing protein